MSKLSLIRSSSSLESFFFIGLDRLSLCIFDGIDNKIFEKTIFIKNGTKKKDLNDLCENFLVDNILKVEKKIGKFINEINLITQNPKFLLIQASVKKDGKGEKINIVDLNHMLFNLKQQVKENNTDKTITYIKINNFQVDKKILPTLDENFVCNELCLQIDFIFLPNQSVENYKKKISKCQIRMDQIFSAEYLKKFYKRDYEDECTAAARLKYENDENEVHLIKKISKKQGFFEKFFKFFN